jgi:hypothetical protein
MIIQGTVKYCMSFTYFTVKNIFSNKRAKKTSTQLWIESSFIEIGKQLLHQPIVIEAKSAIIFYLPPLTLPDDSF